MKFNNYELESLNFDTNYSTERPIVTASSETMDGYGLIRNAYGDDSAVIEHVPISCIEDCLEHME